MNTSGGFVSVVKLGGSLLDSQPSLLRALTWVERHVSRATVVIPGGGLHAEAVRQLDHRAGLPRTISHQLAIRAMAVNAWMLAHLSGWIYVAEWQDVLCRCRTAIDDVARAQGSGRVICVLDPTQFLREVEPQEDGTRLPTGWQSTSDSIAARVAQILSSREAETRQGRRLELILLKSCLPRRGVSLVEASRSGYVDAHFPLATQFLDRVRLVNVRHANAEEIGVKVRPLPTDHPNTK